MSPKQHARVRRQQMIRKQVRCLGPVTQVTATGVTPIAMRFQCLMERRWCGDAQPTGYPQGDAT